jgi:hypothetical protein
MQHDEATLIAGGERHPLQHDQPVLVGAGPVVIVVEGATAAIRLDGRPVQAAWDASSGTATIAVDLARDTGFHELIVAANRAYLFGTEDAKLRIDGVRSMLDYLEAAGLAWSGTMFFSGTDQVLRDPRLDRAWIERTLPELLDVARRIAQRPATMRGSRRVRADHGVPDLAATMALLRARGRDLLEEHPTGPIQVAGPDGESRWAPREVIVRRRTKATDTVGNRRATALLTDVRALIVTTAGQIPDQDIARALRDHLAEIDEVVRLEPFRTLRRRHAHRGLPRLARAEERTDPRYGLTFGLWRELRQERHWDPSRAVMPERAYAGYADRIYQRFCAILLADALGLEPNPRTAGTGIPAFTSSRFDLYVDTKPPSSVLSDWRDRTERPSSLRPDLVLHERASGRVAVLDSKYRRDKRSGLRASGDSLSEVQLYLQAYGRNEVGVLYPPREPYWEINDVTDGQQRIVEIPFRPEAAMAEFLDAHALPTIEGLLA